MGDVDFLHLTGLSLQAVLTVAACSGMGAYTKHRDILTKAGQKCVGGMVTHLFLPSLILQKVTPNMRVVDLQVLWPIAVMCLFTVGFGLFCGKMTSKKISSSDPTTMSSLMMVATGFPNSFSVPLTLTLALPDEVLATYNSGDESISTRVKLLFVVSYGMWVLARWSIGFPILSG